jgi:hypothetical protein
VPTLPAPHEWVRREGRDPRWRRIFLATIGIVGFYSRRQYFSVADLGFPGIFAYTYLVPKTARLGIMSNGLILEALSVRFRDCGFCQGYR